MRITATDNFQRSKLEHYGVRGANLQWISSFLSDRTQKVIEEGKSSCSAPVTSGVPQPYCLPGRVAQSVTCLATDACQTADPGVTSSIPVRSHTLVEIDHEIISTVILLPSADLFKKGCCQLQAKVCARITGKPLVQACPGKSVVR